MTQLYTEWGRLIAEPESCVTTMSSLLIRLPNPALTRIFQVCLDTDITSQRADSVTDMDPVSAIGLASSILTFIDIGYKVVSGTLETAQSGWAPSTERLDVVARDLQDAVARFSKPVSASASGTEKALEEVSVRCQALSLELLALLERFKVPATKPGISWDSFKVATRRMRSESKVQELQTSLAEYRSQILLHLATILRHVTFPMAVRDGIQMLRYSSNSVRK